MSLKEKPVAVTGSDPTLFRYSRATRFAVGLLALGSLSFTLIMLYAALFAPPRDPRQWPWLLGLIVVFSLCTLVVAYSLTLLRSVISVDERHITQIRSDGSSVQIRWDEIARVKDRPWLRRLDIYARDPARVIKIEYEISSFTELHAWIVTRTTLPTTLRLERDGVAVGMLAVQRYEFPVVRCSFTPLTTLEEARPIFDQMRQAAEIGLSIREWERLQTAFEELQLQLVDHQSGRDLGQYYFVLIGEHEAMLALKAA